MQSVTSPEHDRAAEAPDMPPADQELESKERSWQEWMMVGIGLAGLLSVLAVVVAAAALGGRAPAMSRSQILSLSAASASSAQSAAPAGTPISVQVVMKSGAEKARLAPDGKYHTAAIPADFAIHPGDRVTVTVVNYDSMPHTFTSPTLNVNAIIPGGSATAPSKTTFTFSAPAKAGKYLWYCTVPCDPYSMAHVGFMRGYVTVAE